MAKQKLSKSLSDEVVPAFANFDISAVFVLEPCLSFIGSNFRDVCTFVFALDWVTSRVQGIMMNNSFLCKRIPCHLANKCG